MNHLMIKMKSLLLTATLASLATVAVGCGGEADQAATSSPTGASAEEALQAPDDALKAPDDVMAPIEPGAEVVEIPSGPDEKPSLEFGASRPIAPACLKRVLYDSIRYMRVESSCRTDQWVKLIIAFGPDSGCLRVPAGGSRWFSWGWPGKYDGLVSC